MITMGDEMAAKSEPTTVDEYEAALKDEWTQWVAVDAIYVGGVRAHNPGDAVPAANVAAHGWDKAGLVKAR